MILLDTNVISELAKKEPNKAVVAYVGGLAPETVSTAAICEAVIRYGLARMPDGRKRDQLIARMALFFESGFPDQELRFDRECAAVYGEIRHGRGTGSVADERTRLAVEGDDHLTTLDHQGQIIGRGWSGW